MNEANRPPLDDLTAFSKWLAEKMEPHEPRLGDNKHLRANCDRCMYAAFVVLAADAERLDWLEQEYNGDRLYRAFAQSWRESIDATRSGVEQRRAARVAEDSK